MIDKILVKQVEGAVDLESSQEISGQKTFLAPVIIDKQSETHNMIGYEGFMYWATDPTRLNQDNNYRMGVISGSLITQKYYDEKWNNL